MKYEQVIQLYIQAKTSGRKSIRANTLEGYLSAIRCHLSPKWSGRELESITADELQEWVDSFSKAGAARKAFGTFRQIHRWYLREFRVRIYDETQAVELPAKPRRKPNALTMKQAKESLRDMRGESFEPCALVQFSCGLRPCEAIALTWADINLATGEISITKGLHEAFGQVYESPTKTEKSTRTVILPRYAVERLRAIKKAVTPSKHDRLCDMRPSTYRRRVRAWFGKRDIRMCAQWLRHTYGTLALQSGVAIETVALMLGHESISTAYDHYLMSNSTLLRDAQSKFAECLLAS